MLLELVQAGDPILRQTARPLSSQEIVSAGIRELIESMRETMRKAPGVGLAAPQIGQSLQLAVIEDRPEYTKDASRELLKERERKPVAFHVIINPRLTLLERDTVEFFEGCLSVTAMMALVPRARKVRVECMDEKARLRVIEASGWYARILQHEIDHLNGTLYIDQMNTRTFTTVDNFNRYWKDKPMAELKYKSGDRT
ncbi:MAG TPA: peptide deformylase [Candidatus Angelobacter sp.]|jgi:peptide deformylase|nr:peptide deformylase [Candidatus Angelobacter sp.]